MKNKNSWLLLLLLLLSGSAWGQEAEKAQKEEKPLTGWFTSSGVKFVYEDQGEKSSIGLGVSAGIGKNLKGRPLALGLQCDYDWSREVGEEARQPLDAHSVRARAFMRTYVFSRGPVGASFDTSIPLALKVGANGAESFTAGASVTPTAVYFVNPRVTVFLTLRLFELSYSCTVPLQEEKLPPRHKFTAGFLNMGYGGAVIGITWNL